MHTVGTSDRPDWPLAIVIGAGGMGMAVARRLSQRHRILIADIDSARVMMAAELLRTEGGDANAVVCDITDPTSVKKLARETEIMGKFRVLAQVAGLGPSASDYATIVRVNLAGVASVAEALLPLATTGTAAILVSSLAAHGFSPPEKVEALLRDPTHPQLVERLSAALGEGHSTPQKAYQLSKYALVAYCRRMAGAWGQRGARIVSLSPGIIATPMGALEFKHSSRKHQMYEQTPLKREGTMLEIADAVEFLASDRASFISGTDLLVDGGLYGSLSSQ
jgi:NAD(P)-dependent dehydrogenase (short-subunit alcohol dehydrogenase family)